MHVDPRFTRTSAMADIYAPLRAGTDIVFLGGLIRYILEEQKYFKDYVVAYTNAADPDHRRLPGTPRTSTASSRASTPSARSTTRKTWRYDAEPRERPGNQPVREPNDASHLQRPGRQADEAAAHRPDAAAPALRLPDPPPALRPLHARDGRAGLRHAARDVPEGGRDALRRLGPRPHRGDLLRGRLDPAHHGRPDDPRRRRSCSSCSATSAGPAAASSRCAGTPRSRARPTSRRSTTSCPAT